MVDVQLHGLVPKSRDRQPGLALPREPKPVLADLVQPGRVLPDLPGVPLLEMSSDGIVAAVNGPLCDLLGHPLDEIVGHAVTDAVHSADRAQFDESLSTMLTTGQHPPFTMRLVRRDGGVIWGRVTLTMLPSAARILVRVADISDAIRTHDREVASLNRLVALVENSSNYILVVGSTGVLTDANPAFENLIGRRIGESADGILRALVHPDDLASVLDALSDTFASPGPHAPITFRLAARDGLWIHIEMVANNQLANPDIHGVVINGRDVTERVEHALQLESTLKSLIAVMGVASEVRDPYASGHQHRVARLAAAVAEDIGCDADTVEGIRLGATVHDIGKVAVPAEILSYPGRISSAAFEIIKTHCRIGHDIIAGVDFPWPVAAIILQHHERLDGTGYPLGLRGDEILLEAQIVAVADVADAMTSPRPYRAAVGVDAAVKELLDGRGRLYHPAAADACARILRDGIRDLPEHVSVVAGATPQAMPRG